MLARRIIPIPVLAILAVAAPSARAQGEISSQNHPVLARALAENAAADKDGNGTLTLAEYRELQPKKAGPNKPEEPAPLLPVLANGEVVVADFEDNNYRNKNGWKAEGDAFQRDLAQCTKLMKRRVGPYEGKYLLTTITNSDGGVGRLRSPRILLELDYLHVTMSGGDFPQRVCVNLWVDDQLVRSVSGRNDDYFEEVALDVREFKNRMARVEVLDQHRGLWGHLNLDRIAMRAAPGSARVIDTRPVPLVSTAGVAITTAGRTQGALTLTNGRLHAQGEPLAGEILLAINARHNRDQPLPGALRLLNGEVWRADVQIVEGAGQTRTIAITTRMMGARKVPLTKVASMEFVAAEPDAAHEPGTLYRTEGEPIPGKLIWVRTKDIAIRSPLGIVPIPRPTVLRYVLAKPEPPAARTDDEVGLMDGTLLFGKTRFEGSHLVITHEILGELKIDWNAVRSLRRNRAGLTWLDTVKRTVVETVGPVLPPPAPHTLASGEDSHLRALRIMPHTVVRMPLPSGPHGGATLRGELHPVPGARAGLQIALLAGDTTVWNQRVPAGSAPIPLSVNLSSAADLTLRVEFDGPLAFPCGIDLRDAHIVTLDNLGTQSN